MNRKVELALIVRRAQRRIAATRPLGLAALEEFDRLTQIIARLILER